MKNSVYKHRNIAIIFFMIALSLILTPTWLSAQTYPTKPINLLVAFAPGGSLDTTMRVLAKKAEKYLGQPIAIDNNGAAGGAAALGVVAKAKADGYQLVGCTSVGLVGLPQFRPVAYKLSDFVPIMAYAAPESGLLVKGDAPWKTMKELIEYAKKNPGKVTYSTNGIGTTQDMAMKYIAKKEGIKWTVVPFQGQAEALTALLGGHVTASSNTADLGDYFKEGKLRLLATHGEARMKAYPNIPTFHELGYEYVNPTRFMIAAPKGTPQAIVTKLDDAFFKATTDPDFLALMEKLKMEVFYRHPQQMSGWLEEQRIIMGDMIKDFNIPTELKK